MGAIQLSSEPHVGEPVTITITNAARPRVGVPVHAVYEPGSPDQEQTAVGATDGEGETHWTPMRAGAAAIRAAGQQQVVLVSGDGARAWAGVALWITGFGAFLTIAGWALRRTVAR